MCDTNDNRDFGQARPRQQLLRYLVSLLSICAALVLSGCLSTPERPSSVDTKEIVGTEYPTEPAAPDIHSTNINLTTVDDVAIPEQDPVIWQRLRNGFEFADYQHPRIDKEVRRLQRSPRAFRLLMQQSEPYLHFIVNEIEAAGLPMELALLPAVESGFRPHVYSPNGAAGLWQFMPATGRMLGLKQDWWFDRRRTVRQSTHAAITYLSRLHTRFDGDWLHALAAYNAGSAKVGRAIRKARAKNRATDFWSLDLPGETDRYVPRLLALSRIVADPQRFGLELPAVSDTPYFALVETGGQIDLNVAADIAGLSVEDLFALNAGHRRWTSHPDGPHVLLMPVDRVEQFEESLAKLPDEGRLRLTRYLIQPGDSLGVIARRFNVSVSAIKQTNGLRNSRIRAGRHLMIPLSDSVIADATKAGPMARQKTHYRVRRGDSLYTIARRFQVSIADLKRWNQVGRYIRPGDRLTVFIDPDA